MKLHTLAHALLILPLPSLMLVSVPVKASQQNRGGRKTAPAKQSQPNTLFSKLIPILRQKTRVPLRLPAFVPFNEQNKKKKPEDEEVSLHAILDGADENSYSVQLAWVEDCEGGNACHVGELGGSANFHDDYPDQPKIAVSLRGGIKGSFVDATCGAHCDDSILYWSESGYHYSVAIKAGSKELLIQMANSAIEVAERSQP